MVVFPNAKINIGLNITGKRSDGYHDIESVFFPIKLRDVLEIIISSNPSQDISFNQTGLLINGDLASNLCVEAYHLVKKDYPSIQSINLHLHKAIPMGAGLGGGSSDGAFMLKLLNDVFELEIGEDKLIRYALQLGSDCPFFIKNTPCFGSGRGEILNSIDLNLDNYQILVINPGIHVNTGWAFSKLTVQNNHQDLINKINQPIPNWKETITNDFEAPVFEKYPVIKNIKDSMYNHGALYASMSGSGSSVYGIFHKNEKPTIEIDKSHFSIWI